MNKSILEDLSLENVIGLLQADVGVCHCSEKNYERMREGQMADLDQLLHRKLPQPDRTSILGDINDLQDIVAREHFQIGFKAGIKLMNELNKL